MPFMGFLSLFKHAFLIVHVFRLSQGDNTSLLAGLFVAFAGLTNTGEETSAIGRNSLC